MDIVLIPLGFVATGAALWAGAWLLLGDYRRFFVSDPRRAMSTEVFAELYELGGPGYVAAVLFLAGLILVTIGLGFVGLGLFLVFFR